MKLREWVEREGPGAMSRLQTATGLAWTTIFKAVHGGADMRASTMTAISEATGGEVTVAELCEPIASDSTPPSAA